MSQSSISHARALLAAAFPASTLADGREVLAVQASAGTSIQAWRALTEIHVETGLWPFLADPKREDRRPTVWDNLTEHRQVTVDDPETVDVGRRADYLEVDEQDPFYDEDEQAEIRAARSCGPLALAAEPAPGTSWAADTTQIGLCPPGPEAWTYRA